MHRAYKPTEEDVKVALDIVEPECSSQTQAQRKCVKLVLEKNQFTQSARKHPCLGCPREPRVDQGAKPHHRGSRAKEAVGVCGTAFDLRPAHPSVLTLAVDSIFRRCVREGYRLYDRGAEPAGSHASIQRLLHNPVFLVRQLALVL